MILRSMVIENWRCIGKLELADLAEGIVVLYGPNGTGKTSIVRALRSCLFDADHDTGGKEFSKNLPWQAGGRPRVIVEFCVHGAEYRLSKTFAKTKEGGALLEKRAGERWIVEESAPKEASRKARELLGAEKSEAGLNQLLWLSQGEIALPEKLDQQLEGSVASVLGMMVTGRDLQFRNLLEKRCGRWFTEGGKLSKKSKIAELQETQANLQESFNKLAADFASLEKTINELQALEDGLPALRKDVHDAELELKQTGLERDRCKERVVRFETAEKAHADAGKALEIAETALRRYQEDAKALESKTHEKGRAEEELAQITEELGRQEQAHREKQQELENARHQERLLDRPEEDLNALRSLLSLTKRARELSDGLRRFEQLEKECSDLEEKLSKLAAPNEAGIKNLRDNRRLAQELRAQLDAAAWDIRIEPGRTLEIGLAIDGREAERRTLPEGTVHEMSARQQAQLEIAGVGKITLSRARAALDLAESAHKLASLDSEYTEAIAGFGENAEDETCLDRLAEKRLQRESLAKALAQHRQTLQAEFPEGGKALALDKELTARQREQLLQRHPALAQCDPTEREVNEKTENLRAERLRLKEITDRSSAAARDAQLAFEQARERCQKKKDELLALQVALNGDQEALQRQGDVPSLTLAVASAQGAFAQAAEALKDTQLTEEELSIEERYKQADSVCRNRQERLRGCETRIAGLRGVLQGNEGLHTRLADAEAALRDVEKRLEREELEADAHQKLRMLFEAARDQQVQQVMGPISGRVLEWAHRIGLDAYHDVRFEDAYLPQGLVRDERAVSLSDESHGIHEQLSLLVRLALGGILARDEPAVAILDDPLAHADAVKHRRMLDVLRLAAEGNPAWNPPAGKLQILIFTCHPERFDYLTGVPQIDLTQRITRQI